MVVAFLCFWKDGLGVKVALAVASFFVVVPYVPHLLYQIAKYLKVAQYVSVYFLLIHF